MYCTRAERAVRLSVPATILLLGSIFFAVEQFGFAVDFSPVLLAQDFSSSSSVCGALVPYRKIPFLPKVLSCL
jgi:hypothetical protein